MKKFSRIIRYLLPYKWNVTGSLFLMVLTALFSVSSIVLIAPFLDLLFGKTDLITEPVKLQLSLDSLIRFFNYKMSVIIINKGPDGKVYALLFVGVLVLGATILKNLFFYFSKFLMIPARSGVVRDIRNKAFEKILSLPLGFFSEERKGDIIARMSQDVQEIETSVIRSFEMLLKNPILVISYLIALFIMSVKLTLFVLILLPVSGLVIGRVGRTLRSTSFKGQKRLGMIMSHLEEALAGLRIIKAFNAEEKMNLKFRRVNHSYTRLLVRLFRRQQLASPVSEVLGIAIFVVVLWYGGKMVLDNQNGLEPSLLIAYLALFSQIINPAKTITTAYFSILKGMASVDRVDELMDAEVKIHENENPVPAREFKSRIEFRDVDFQYETEPVLNNINLTIEKGNTIALVGRSGSGKSTLVDLLPRFIDAKSGDVLIDGVNVKDLNLKDLRRLMGIVSQQSILFNDTFFNNISFGMDHVTEEEVIAAARVANAHDFIMENPQGYHANIGEGGGKLSGGQKQRISIARAVLKNPPILILDEATSALDTESERLVQDAIVKLMENRTSIVIAHRLSTVMHADQILVMDNGKIVESGKHEELIEIKGGTYKKLHKLQMY